MHPSKIGSHLRNAAPKSEREDWRLQDIDVFEHAGKYVGYMVFSSGEENEGGDRSRNQNGWNPNFHLCNVSSHQRNVATVGEFCLQDISRFDHARKDVGYKVFHNGKEIVVGDLAWPGSGFLNLRNVALI